ncbi:hypothetical protein A1D29_07760 [Pasteurellaceae bacterium Orientalotternb1]|nr:hypothetical protein A1D29_07760 [Pasteurellaceae bacterium Orientalotternb1]
MELPNYTKLIDDFITKENAMTLLFETYQAAPNKEEQDKFVLVLIGLAVVSHQMLQHKMKK